MNANITIVIFIKFNYNHNMKKDFKFISIIALCSLGLIGYFSYICYQEFFPIHFSIETDNIEKIQINDMNIQFDKNDNSIIYPTTFNTLYPNKIQVNSAIKYRKIGKLSKEKFLPIQIKLSNGEIKEYKIQTLPNIFPHFYTNTNKYHKGYVLTSVHGLKLIHPSYAIIMKPSSKIVWYRGNENPQYSAFHLQQHRLDKKVRYSMHTQTDNFRTEFIRGKHLLLDEKFNIIDEVQILATDKHPAMPADEHEFVYIDDGHYIVLGYEVKKKYVKKYKKKVTYIANIIQEQKDGKVLFDWVSDEHPEFYNFSTEQQVNSDSMPDYMHINSFDIDPKDNNIVFSSASGYNIIKINRKTGNIMWTLGGNEDQFNITKEQYFIRQHDVQITEDGDLLIFDNGDSDYLNKKIFNPHPSRGIKFKLDEENKKILKAQILPFNDISKFMGSVQLLKDKNTMFGCGGNKKCIARILNPKGKKLLDIQVQRPYFSYRSYWVKSLK